MRGELSYYRTHNILICRKLLECIWTPCRDTVSKSRCQKRKIISGQLIFEFLNFIRLYMSIRFVFQIKIVKNSKFKILKLWKIMLDRHHSRLSKTW